MTEDRIMSFRRKINRYSNIIIYRRRFTGKSKSLYTYTGIVYTTENEVATPLLVTTKKVDLEPVKENIIDTKNQIRVPNSK